MILILLFALVLFGYAVVLALRALRLGRAGTEQRLAQIGAYGFAGLRPGPAATLTLRSRLDAFATSLGSHLDGRLGEQREQELRRQLYAAGLYRTTPRKFLGYRLISTIVLVGFWLWLIAIGGGSASAAILGAACLGVLAWIGPLFVVKRRAAARLQQIDHEIPELVDLLVTAVEGGLGFAGSLQLASQSLESALGDEIRLALQEQNMGLTVNEALKNMVGRIDTLAMRSFVQAVIQGESLGVSIGKILRDLASEMRSRRRQAAEEQAHKAGTKIIFPVALCIFPAIFVVALGPMAIYLSRTLGGI
jgi:tight adherence protein C